MKNKKTTEIEPKETEPKEEKKDPLAELTELLQRTQADFENYRKQAEKRALEVQKMAGKEIILQVIPLLDNFELALKNVDVSNRQDFVKGIELIYAQFNEVLENNGVKIIATTGQTFDPYYHEALLKVDSELPENAIIEEFQKGFTMHGQVIRHAKVKVSNGKKGKESEKQEPGKTDKVINDLKSDGKEK